MMPPASLPSRSETYPPCIIWVQVVRISIRFRSFSAGQSLPTQLLKSRFLVLPFVCCVDLSSFPLSDLPRPEGAGVV